MCVAQEQAGSLNIDQKLLYILLHLQNWVSTARDAMVQSYEPEKMWPPVRYGTMVPREVSTAGLDFFSELGTSTTDQPLKKHSKSQ